MPRAGLPFESYYTRMEVVTDYVNVMRGVGFGAKNLAKTHCPQGHPFSGENLRVYVRASGARWRLCITCQAIRNAKHGAKRRKKVS